MVRKAIEWIKLYVSRQTVVAAIRALTQQSDTLHQEAMVEPDTVRRSSLRAEADYLAGEKSHLYEAMHKEPMKTYDESMTTGKGSSINKISINLGGSTLMVVVVLVCVIGANGIVMGLNLAKQSQQDQAFRDLKTQEWLVERRLMDDEAYRIVNGQKVESDNEFGPTGNIHRMAPKPKGK